jgi:Lrp/AsnC family leucine-responsive transcriptional regulator
MNSAPMRDTMDAIDEQILELLRHNGRMAVREIAGRVGLSTGPVSRRIAKLESSGVIRGYVAVIDDGRSGALEAFTEVRLHGTTETGELEEVVRDLPEVQQYFTISGDPDALIHFRVKDVGDLQRVVNGMRRTGKVAGTKTLIVMASWQRDGRSP